MCSDLDPDPYFKGQGHMRHLKVRVHMLVSALLLTYALMNYHLTWYKCCPHWNDVQWPWPWSKPQRSRSHKTFKGQSTHTRVCAVTYIYIDGLPFYLVQMLSSLRRCAVTLTRIHTSKVKVTWYQTTCISYFPILDQRSCTILVRFNVPVRLREKQNVF